MVASVAVATGIPPQYLLDDTDMLRAILAVMSDQQKEFEKSKRRR